MEGFTKVIGGSCGAVVWRAIEACCDAETVSKAKWLDCFFVDACLAARDGWVTLLSVRCL